MRPPSSSSLTQKHVELEGILDRWYFELPVHLRYECSGKSKGGAGGGAGVPLPHVLTLHMQYWCAVLLLHRPLWVFFPFFVCVFWFVGS